MVTGFLLSGYIISKYKPSPRKLFMWNIIVGFGYVAGQISYIFLSCDNNYITEFSGTLNLTAQCNANCSCTGVAYSPVCYEPTSTTFFSPCHAGCNKWDDKAKFYDNCACAVDNQFTKLPLNYSSIMSTTAMYTTLAKSSFTTESTVYSSILTTTLPAIISTEVSPVSTASTPSTIDSTENVTVENEYEPTLFKAIINTTDSNRAEEEPVTTENPTSDSNIDQQTVNKRYQEETTIPPSDYAQANDYSITEESISRRKRSSIDDENSLLKMVPGACLAGCAKGFYLFTIISFIINWFGSTGRIGNLLLNFR